MTETVLIFRTGSIGDAVVSLPALHVVQRAFPDSRRLVLTNRPVMAKTSAVDAVLGASGLVDETVHFDAGGGTPGAMIALARRLRPLRPRVLVWLAEARPAARMRVLRLFFRMVGVRRFVGLPAADAYRNPRPARDGELWENEAERLARAVAALGDAALDDPASWDFHFTDAERAEADAALAGWPGRDDFMGFSIGGKADVKDWGDDNWRQVLAALAGDTPGLGLALFGAADEAERSAALAAAWPGPVLNLCGEVAPRTSALVLARARCYLGHDSGPMHLAAAGGVPAVAVFSGQRKPGVWFPWGFGHRPLYNRTPCFGCYRDDCPDLAKMCILGIAPAEVVDATREVLARPRTAPP